MTAFPFHRITDAAGRRARTFAVGLAIALAAFLCALPPAHAVLNTAENAIDILGEYNSTAMADNPADYTKSCINDGALLGFETSYGYQGSGVAIDATNHRLFVGDTGNNRVLVFTLTTGNLLASKTPSYVLGQADFQSCNGIGTSQSSIGGPVGLAYDAVNNRLFVASNSDSRVLEFDFSGGISNNMLASYVLGQSSWTGNAQGLSSTGLNLSQVGGGGDVAYDGSGTTKYLYVADGGNNRVMVFAVPYHAYSNGENASYVLGASDFVGDGSTGTSQSKMVSPVNLAYDSTNNQLYVLDEGNDRVMLFNTSALVGGMVGWWQFNEDTGTTTADSSGYGDTGTLAGTTKPTWDASGITGSALDFVYANNSYVSFNVSSSYPELEVSGSWTVSAWVKPTTPWPNQYDQGTIFGTWDGSYNSNMSLWLDYGSGTLPSTSIGWAVVFQTSGGTYYYVKQTASSPTAGTWYFLTGVWNVATDTLYLYVNGSLIGSQTGDPSPTNAFSGGSIGQYFTGTVDDVRVFNTALTAGEITQLYNSGSDSLTTNGENATDELGQYTSASSTATNAWTQYDANNSANALGFDVPTDVALDPVNHVLYVSDCDNWRVLVYTLNADNSISTTSGGHTASYVIGQPSLKGSSWGGSAAGGMGAAAFSCPLGLAVDTAHSRLFVVDSNGDRVLVFPTPITSNGESATYALGEPDFNSYDSSGLAGQAVLSNPTDVAYDSVNNVLYVSDGLNRIMVFDFTLVPIATGMNASYEIGQPSATAFTTYGADYDTGSTVSANALNTPAGLAFDSTNLRLFVADSGNNRVLVFPTAATGGPLGGVNGEAATYVLGQTTMAGNGSAQTQSAMSAPTGVAYDSNNSRLFVADGQNTRVTAFNVAPGVIAKCNTTPPCNAAFEVGQYPASWTTYADNTTQSGLATDNYGQFFPPAFPRYDPGSGRLFVPDTANNRVMIFEGSALSPWLPGDAP